MKRETVKMMASWALALALSMSTARNAQAQDAKNPYPSMAPIEKYLMDRDAEIALARSAAPSSISRESFVLLKLVSSAVRPDRESAVHSRPSALDAVRKAAVVIHRALRNILA
jgi:hypothetical protein